MSFKPGDVVILKSGGVSMTVDEPTANGKFKCVWMDGSEVKQAVFAAALLMPADMAGDAFMVDDHSEE